MKKTIAIIVLFLAAATAWAAEKPSVAAEVIPAQSTTAPGDTAFHFSSHGPNWKNPVVYKDKGIRFSWGADAGTSVDLSGQDMSSIDISASFGLTTRWLNFVGVGAGAHVMISNSCRSYPIFAIVRTDFSRILRPMFIDIRGGIALNYLPGDITQTGGYISPSLGFRLAFGKTFRSYITAGYTFIDRRNTIVDGIPTRFKPMQMATMRLGVKF